jgi:hypothetical protein
MLANRQASLTCNGKFIVAGRAHFVWETFLMRRIAGVPGVYEIGANGLKRHRLDWTIQEAEEVMLNIGTTRTGTFFAARKLARGRRTRAERERRGLEVA